MHKRVKKLALSRETLRQMDAGGLGEVAGGWGLYTTTEALSTCIICIEEPTQGCSYGSCLTCQYTCAC